ncbi:MAG: hypothetical protein QOH61_2066 [Chloroflexota bacterium]|jgi:hypothetical protein|nr:hypothetical protein [Chloroflexota bacterium]
MPFRSPRAFHLLVATALVVVVTAFSAVPVAALETRWPAAEQYALSLMNCTRTGGWVKKDGTCIDRGTGQHSKYRKPLLFKERLAKDISRPQARRVAKAGYLSHEIGGSKNERFARAGIKCCATGESLGHYVGNPKAAVVMVNSFVQDEKGTGGPHWRQLKDSRFKFVGIGVWKRGNDVYVAYDFWDGP